MPKNLTGSKRQRPSAVTSILTNKHKVTIQKHLQSHKHYKEVIAQDGNRIPTFKMHNHHSHLKCRYAPDYVIQDDRIKITKRGKCFTHDELRKNRMISKGKKKNYTQSGFKLLQLVLAHPQGFHDAMSKLAHESEGIDVHIYVH